VCSGDTAAGPGHETAVPQSVWCLDELMNAWPGNSPFGTRQQAPHHPRQRSSRKQPCSGTLRITARRHRFLRLAWCLCWMDQGTSDLGVEKYPVSHFQMLVGLGSDWRFGIGARRFLPVWNNQHLKQTAVASLTSVGVDIQMQHGKTAKDLKRDSALAVTRREETDLKRLVNQTWTARRVRC
jgi:hypothetical protein